MKDKSKQPKEGDAVLGGQNLPPKEAVVLGGIEGIKRRLVSKDAQVRIAALADAVNYANAGLDLLIEALQDEANTVRQTAYFLLQDKTEPKIKKALKIFRSSSLDRYRGVSSLSIKPDKTKHKQAQDHQSRLIKTAMTWRLLDERREKNRQYGLFGSDNITNPYKGDTNINEELPILCIAKENLPKPEFISPNTTPGGALRGSWSGARVFFTQPIPGYQIISRAEGDRLCNEAANSQPGIGNGNYRMAEFHDGDQQAGWAGWDFWADITDVILWDVFKTLRYWVAINDQRANPWNLKY